LTGISKSALVNVKLDFNGEIRNYSFNTTELRKILTAKVIKQAMRNLIEPGKTLALKHVNACSLRKENG